MMPQSDDRARRALVGPAVMTVGACVTLAGSFSVWVRSGRIGRSSFELLGVIERLGFVPNGPTRAVVRAWPVMPLLLTVGVVCAWWGWRVAGAAAGAIGAVFAGSVGGVVVFAAPEVRGVDLSVAPAVTLAGAVLALLGSLFTVVVRVPSANAKP